MKRDKTHMCIAIFLLIALFAGVESPAMAQPRNILTDPLSPYRLPSIGDHFAEMINQMQEYGRQVQDFNREIATARREFWNAYPAAADFPRASSRLGHILTAKDYLFLNRYFTDVAAGGKGSQIHILLDSAGGQVDGGISPAAQPYFYKWASAVTENLFSGRQGLLGSIDFLRQVNTNPASVWAEIRKSDPLYQEYVAIRDLEEYRKANKVPQGFPAEAWRVALIGIAITERKKDSFFDAPRDPYGEALKIITSEKGFDDQCPIAVKNLFGPLSTAGTCGCLKQLFSGFRWEEDRWSIETDFSEERLLAAMVFEVGMKEKATACLH